MSRLSILLALLVFVCAISARPNKIIRQEAGPTGDAIYHWNLSELSVGSSSSVADSSLQKSESKSALPGSLYENNRFKRSWNAQNQGGIRYNGITIKLPEGDGLVNSLMSSSTEKPRTKPINRLNRIHIRIG